MNRNIINIWYAVNTYKKASCKGCYERLIEGSKILSVCRVQGRFNSVSNYCGKCASAQLQSAMDETAILMRNIIKIQETLDGEKQIEACYNEAKAKFGTTLEKLGNEYNSN